MQKKTGIVLTGGGARAAYQAGVLRGLSEILPHSESPFQIFAGVSAGSINSTVLASGADDFKKTTQAICDLWGNLQVDQVFKTDSASLAKIALGWIKDISLGGVLKNSSSLNLLDFSPLRDFLKPSIDFQKLKTLISDKKIHGFALSATNYFSGTAVTFYDGDKSIDPWVRSSRMGTRTEITLDHVLASCAIPIFFQPIHLGEIPYGDGCLRLNAPLSPAIHLGSEKVLAIGIRHNRSSEKTFTMQNDQSRSELKLVDIAGVILNAMFLDSLDADLERMDRINATLKLLGPNQSHPRGLRPIPVYSILPSRDLGALASELFDELPSVIRYLLSGLGASRENGWDLISYLSFDSSYTKRLIELGYHDVFQQKEELISFFES